jgi:hypothetical protein
VRVKHGDQLVADGIHVAHALEYADQAARVAASVTSADIGKLARQLDTGKFYVLTDTTPEWDRLGPTQTFLQLTTETQEATAAGGTEYLGQREFNAGDYVEARYRFKAVGKVTAGSTMQLGLYNLTRSEFVTGATLTFTSSSYVKQESSDLTVGSDPGDLREADDLYEVQAILDGVAGQTGYIGSGTIVVDGAAGMA